MIYISYQILLYDQIVKKGMGRVCSTDGERRDEYGILVGRPEVKRPLERPWGNWKDNIKIYV
jgi:hypothetical protein